MSWRPWNVSWDAYCAGADLEAIGRRDAYLARRIRRSVTAYAETGQGDVLKMKGYADRWRQRVGERRVIFPLDRDSRTLIVLSVALRKDVYRS